MSPETKEFLTVVGGTLYIVQAAERILAEALVMVFPDRVPSTMEELLSDSDNVRLKTLGRLMGRLREKVEISEDLDQMLRDFLADRNTFIHRLEEVGKPQMYSPEGLRKAGGFVTDLYTNARFLMTVFADLIVRWADEMEIDGGRIRALREIIAEEHVGISEGAIFPKAG